MPDNLNFGTSLTDNSDAVQQLLQKLKPANNVTPNITNSTLSDVTPLQEQPQVQPNPMLEAIKRLGTVQPNPDVDKFKSTINEVPLHSQEHIPWYRKLASIPIGAAYGPQEQQGYLHNSYRQAYQDWANKVAAQEKGLTIPAEIQNLQNKPVLDMLRAQGDVLSNEERQSNIDLNKRKVADYQPPLTFEQRKELKETGVPKAEPKETEFDQRVETKLQEKGLTLKTASPEQKDAAIKAVDKDKHIETPSENIGHELAIAKRIDNNITKAHTKVELKEKPYLEDSDTLTRLNDIITNGTQATDPLITPLMIKGIDQMKRASDAEISRVYGGPDKFEQFQRFINSWKPTENGIFGERRYQMPQEIQDQIKKTVNSLKRRNELRLDAINEAKSKILSSTNPAAPLQIYDDLDKKLQEIDKQDLSKEPVPLVFSWSKYHSKHPDVSRKDFEQKVMDAHGKMVE